MRNNYIVKVSYTRYDYITGKTETSTHDVKVGNCESSDEALEWAKDEVFAQDCGYTWKISNYKVISVERV